MDEYKEVERRKELAEHIRHARRGDAFRSMLQEIWRIAEYAETANHNSTEAVKAVKNVRLALWGVVILMVAHIALSNGAQLETFLGWLKVLLPLVGG